MVKKRQQAQQQNSINNKAEHNPCKAYKHYCFEE